MKIVRLLFLALAALWFEPAKGVHAAADGGVSALAVEWTRLPAIPDREGFAGPFAGVSGDALLVAGGANFPDKKPWEGGTKVWYDSVFVLGKNDGAWRRAGKLPRATGYGVCANFRDGVVCVGGSDATQHRAEVFRLEWRAGALKFVGLPPLPRPLANACGVLLGETFYVLGGTFTPTATEAARGMFALDLAKADARWQELEPWPGRGRMLATAGALGGEIFLFGGTALTAGADGKPVRELLRDAFCFAPGKGWRRVADLPRPAVAAPTPALVAEGKLLVVGGDDGAQLTASPGAHKGFPREVLAYDPRTDRWETRAAAPFALVTTVTTEWNGRSVIPGGEVRPGVRSTEVWSGKLKGR